MIAPVCVNFIRSRWPFRAGRCETKRNHKLSFVDPHKQGDYSLENQLNDLFATVISRLILSYLHHPKLLQIYLRPLVIPSGGMEFERQGQLAIIETDREWIEFSLYPLRFDQSFVSIHKQFPKYVHGWQFISTRPFENMQCYPPFHMSSPSIMGLQEYWTENLSSESILNCTGCGP